MFKYFNPHPKGLLTDDCVKRAIVVTTGWDYAEVQKRLNEYKKISGAKTFNDRENLVFVETVLGAKAFVPKKQMTVAEFCKKHRRGRYILDMRGHWSASVDGCIYDTWDTSNEILIRAYKISTKHYKAPDIKNQAFKSCCTSQKGKRGQTIIRIYDGNGSSVERIIPRQLTEGYVRCLMDNGYSYVKL